METNSKKQVMGIAIRLSFSPRNVKESARGIFLNITWPEREHGEFYRGTTVFPTSLKIQEKYQSRLNKVLFFTPDMASIYEGDILKIINNDTWDEIKHAWKNLDVARTIASDLELIILEVEEICTAPQWHEWRTDMADIDRRLRRIAHKLKKKKDELQEIERNIGSTPRHESAATVKEDTGRAIKKIGCAERFIDKARRNIGFGNPSGFYAEEEKADARVYIREAVEEINGARKEIEKEKPDLYPDLYKRHEKGEKFISKEYYPFDGEEEKWIIIENLKKIKAEDLRCYYVYGTNYLLADKVKEPAFPRVYYSDAVVVTRHEDSEDQKYAYCPYCGKQLLSKDFLYCPYCGSSLRIK